MNTDNRMERELSWDDTIERDPGEFILLPEGDYDFVVTQVERARHSGSAKLPPCNKAIVHLEIQADEGTVTIKHNLFLHTITEGLLSAFFGAIGQKKHGEPLRMNWNQVPGSTGRCRISVRNWTGNDGQAMQSNEVKRFYHKDDIPATTGTVGGWKPGVF